MSGPTLAGDHEYSTSPIGLPSQFELFPRVASEVADLLGHPAKPLGHSPLMLWHKKLDTFRTSRRDESFANFMGVTLSSGDPLSQEATVYCYHRGSPSVFLSTSVTCIPATRAFTANVFKVWFLVVSSHN